MSEIEIPEGWEFKKLDDLSLVERGISWSKTDESKNASKTSIPVLRIGNVRERQLDLNNILYLENQDTKKISNNKVSKNDILMVGSNGNRDLVGRSCKIEEDMDFVYASFLMGIKKISSEIDPDFLLYYLNSSDGLSFLQKSTSSGVGINNLKISDLRTMPIVYPKSKITQKNIVKKLDSILENIEEKKKKILPYVEKLENSFTMIPPSFHNRIIAKNNLFLIMRNHVLQKSFSGIDSENFRKNKINYESNWHEDIEQKISQIRKKLKKPESKFEIISKEITELFPIPTPWIWTNIRSIETMVGSGSTPKGGKSNYVEKGIPFIRSQNVLFNQLDLKDVVFIPKTIHDNMKRTHVKPNDVLLNITGASIGRSTPVFVDFQEGNVNQHVCIIRTGNWVNPKYLSFWLNSQYVQNFINSIQIGATKEGLNFEHVRSFPIPLPKIEEQNYIVNEIEKKIQNLTIMHEQMKKSLNFQKSSLKLINGLSRSILNYACSGKLVN